MLRRRYSVLEASTDRSPCPCVGASTAGSLKVYFQTPQLLDPLSEAYEDSPPRARFKTPAWPLLRLSQSLPGRGPRARSTDRQTALLGQPRASPGAQNPRRRSGGDLRPCPHGAAREGREDELAAAAKPRPKRPIRPETDPNRPIRPGTDKDLRKPGLPSHHVPREVKRAVWGRDAGQCAFVSPTGRRCAERTFLEFHHIEPYAKQGPATIANISLRCWRHNQYEAELIFGPHGPAIVNEAPPSLGLARSGPSMTIDS